jgi:hypothetical protein
MVSKLKKASEILAAARAARQRTGKGIIAQFVEMGRLRGGYGSLVPLDYYMYHVFDDSRYPGTRKGDVVSWDVRVLARLNNPRWREIADDKLLLYALLKGIGISNAISAAA